MAELLRTRKHMRQRIGMIRHRIDIEEHRAWNMRGEIVVLRQRQHARQLERGVDHPDLGIAEMRGEPFGGDEWVGGGHESIPFSDRRGRACPGHPRPSIRGPPRTWMPGTSSAKTRFALLPGHDGGLVAYLISPSSSAR